MTTPQNFTVDTISPNLWTNSNGNSWQVGSSNDLPSSSWHHSLGAQGKKDIGPLIPTRLAISIILTDGMRDYFLASFLSGCFFFYILHAILIVAVLCMFFNFCRDVFVFSCPFPLVCASLTSQRDSRIRLQLSWQPGLQR